MQPNDPHDSARAAEEAQPPPNESACPDPEAGPREEGGPHVGEERARAGGTGPTGAGDATGAGGSPDGERTEEDRFAQARVGVAWFTSPLNSPTLDALCLPAFQEALDHLEEQGGSDQALVMNV